MDILLALSIAFPMVFILCIILPANLASDIPYLYDKIVGILVDGKIHRFGIKVYRYNDYIAIHVYRAIRKTKFIFGIRFLDKEICSFTISNDEISAQLIRSTILEIIQDYEIDERRIEKTDRILDDYLEKN